MTIGEQIEQKQPQIYNFLIDLFRLDLPRTDRIKPVEYDPEDDPAFRKHKKLMEERRGFKL